MHRLSRLSGNSLRWAQIILVLAPCFFIYGYNQAGMGPLANSPGWAVSFPSTDTLHTSGHTKDLHATYKGTVIASLQVGGLFGSFACTWISERFGCRRTIFVGGVFTLVGQLLQVSAYSLAQFTIGRVLLGIGIGQFSVAVPVWLSECSGARHRGQNIIISGLFMCLGYSLSNWFAFAFAKIPHASSMQWRGPLSLSFAPSLLAMASVFLLPESPRWLAGRDRIDEATRNLAKFKGSTPEDSTVRHEIASIQQSLAITEQRGSLWHYLRTDDKERYAYRFFICMSIQFFQQMCGGTLISIYSSEIFQNNLHLGANLSSILGACAMTWKFLCCFVSFSTIDRFGRRFLFMVSGTGMAVCMASMAVAARYVEDSKAAAYAMVALMFLFNFFYPFGFIGANFLYCTEVAPVHLRVAMASVSTANHWLWNFLVAMITPVAIQTIGYLYFVMFAIITSLIPVFVYFFFPETMNRNLELLDQVFRDADTIWQIVGMARHLPQGDVPTEKAIMESSEKDTDAKVDLCETA